jgi:hypothetical protein
MAMKKFIALTLATMFLAVIIAGCGKTSQNTQSTIKAWPNDVAKGQSYTFISRNHQTGEETQPLYLEGTPVDRGRINDGLFRTVEELEQDLGDDKIILLQGDANFENVITFQMEDAYEMFAVVIHNTRQVEGNSLKVRKIEIGDTEDTLKEMKYQDKTEDVEVGDLIHNILSFEPVAGKTIRVTFDSDGQSICALEEISIIGYPIGEGDKWLPKGWKPGKDIPEYLLK